MKILSAEFVTSAPTLRHAPDRPGTLEIALVGRSNVGKSSFLNSLVQRNKLASSSRTPGRTRLLNYYLVNETWFLVDLPGYGYAKVSKSERERLARASEEYLGLRESLVLVVQLVDARHGPQESDLQTHAWLAGRGRRVQVVLTKADKLSRSQVARSLRESSASLGLPPAEVLPYSSVTGQGRLEVLKRLALALAP